MKKSFKIFISTILVLVLMMTVAFAIPGQDTAPGELKKQYTEEQAFNFEFNDMTGHWAMNSVQNLAAMGKIKGIGNGKFAPQSSAKQIEVLIMTLRYLDLENELDSDALLPPAYKGMKPQEWMVPYLELAIVKEILTKEEAEDFNPNKPASRSWTAMIIVKALGEEAVVEAEGMQDDPLTYNDATAVPEDRIGYVNYVTQEELMIGHNNTFQPNKPLSRAEMAVLFERLYNLDDDRVWYTITLKVKGDANVTRTFYDGKIITKLEITEKTGYTLNGWYNTDALVDEVIFPYTVDGDAYFFAEWVIKDFTVTFDENGGTTVAAIYVDYDENITEPVEPTRTGYTFDGWFYDDVDFENEFDFDEDKITEDTTLYAKWIINYTIEFETNGGEPVDDIIQAEGTEIDPVPVSTKTGYEFEGWYTDSELTNKVDFEEYTITADATLYANWNEVTE